MKKLDLKSMFFMLMAAATMPLFAAGEDIMPPGLTTLSKQILDIFTGAFVKTLLVIIFCGCAVAYAFNKDNEKMKRNLIAVGIGTAILATSSWIVGTVFNSAKTDMTF